MKYILIFLHLFFLLNIWASDVCFENISSDQGLSQNEVNCILQDKQGFMWFGTNDGLNRYDGYDFQIRRFQVNKQDGLNSNLISALAEDKFQNIWVGTADRGLNRILYSNDRVQNIVIPDTTNNLLAREKIVGIDFIDDLAVVFSKERIYFFRITANTYTPLKVNDEYFVKTGAFATRSFYRLSEREYVLGTTNGIRRVSISTIGGLKVKIKAHRYRLNINKVVPFRKGLLLGGVHSMYYIDENFKFDLFAFNNYSSIVIENDKYAWAASSDGIDYIEFENPPSVKFKVLKHYSRENTDGGLGHNIINTIYRDKMGIIWVGTAGGGVSKLLRRDNKFTLYKDKLQSANLKENNITVIFEDSNENLWVGTNKGGISYFAKENRNYNSKPKEIRSEDPKKNFIREIFEIDTKRGKFIITTSDYVLNIQAYTLEGKHVPKLPVVFDLRRIKHPINDVANDGTFLWLATREGGLYRYNIENRGLTRFLNNSPKSISSNAVNSLCNDSKNRLWIATSKGLNLLLPEQKSETNPKLVKFNRNNRTTSISYDYILPIIETTNREIWIGTLGGGLNRFNETTQGFERFTVENGLPNNSVKAIVEDEQSRLWISTNKGISCLDRKDNSFLNFSITDGLQGYEFEALSATKRRSGQLIFGGDQGFNTFWPSEVQIDSTMPNLVFTNMEFARPVGSKDKAFSRAVLAQTIEQQKTLALNYNEKSFTAYFSALHYIAPEKIQYKYRLLGFEERWITSSFQSRFAKYTNLHPGTYTLQVLATNSDGIWMPTPLELPLVIRQPWYRSIYAYLTYILIFSLSIWFFNKYSLIRNKIKHELLLERFEKEKEQELTQVKLRFFTNISHELRTPLTILKSYFENIVDNWKSLPEQKVTEDFSVISRNIDALLRMVSQILDFRKLEQDKMKLVPQKGNIIELIESVVASFSILAVNKKIELKFSKDTDSIELWFDRDNMEKILNNILSNAIKYTPEEGKVNLRVHNLAQEVKIEVQDNGVGIPEEMQASIFKRFFQADTLASHKMESTGIGLSLTKGLVDLHKGRIELISNEGFGSNFILFFKKGDAHFVNNEAVSELKVEDAMLLDNDASIQEETELATPVVNMEKRVLIVEDNKDLRTHLKEMLSQYFTVDEAENGKVGLEKCLDIIPDLVISDIMMPEMNGYQLCHNIKEDDRICHIPVILLTAKTTMESQLQGFSEGADAYVSKPFNINVLIAQMSATLKSREKVLKRIQENPFFNPSEATFTARDEQFLQKVTNIVEEHMADPDFSVEQLAHLIKVSKVNLNKKLKALTGRTSVQFIRLMRLRKAAQLLLNADSRVSDVTYEVGYADLQHFREHFKKEFKQSPSEYKKRKVI